MSEPLLELIGINKSFGPVHVLHDVDFTVRAGEVTALVGDNGAGKSTLIKCVAGIYPMDSGEVRFRGRNPAWSPNPDSPILRLMQTVYTELVGSEPVVSHRACSMRR